MTDIPDTERIGKYLRVRPEPSGWRSTYRWDVLSNDDHILGDITWYTSWRQYVFHPEICCVFNHGCLDDIAAFLRRVNDGHAASKREEK